MVIPGAGVAGKIGTVVKITEDVGKATKLAKLAGKVVKVALKAKTAITASKIADKVKKAVINSAKVTVAVVKGTAKHFVDSKQLAKIANSTGFMGTPVIKHAADSLAAGVKAGAKEAKKISKEANREKLDSLKRVSKTPSKKVVDNPFANGKVGKLKPNVRYKTSLKGTDHDYWYETDVKGRIERVQAEPLTLKADGRERAIHDSHTPDKLATDQAGHIIADMFDGDPTLKNLVSQDAHVNMKTLLDNGTTGYRGVEKQWESALKNGKEVKLDIKLKYNSDSARPDEFIINSKIEGEAQREITILNEMR
jgi:hypothetical protein